MSKSADLALESMLSRIGQSTSTDTVANPYQVRERLWNLAVYLHYCRRALPNVMLVGEAPGHRGCGSTGIPFTSGYELHHSQAPFFQQCRSQLWLGSDTKEASAAQVWGCLIDVGMHAVLWNAFPFHPHPPGLRNANRRPSPTELAYGIAYLETMFEIYTPQRVVAIGRISESVLARMGVPHTYVRHPSHGGAVAFREGVARFILRDVQATGEKSRLLGPPPR